MQAVAASFYIDLEGKIKEGGKKMAFIVKQGGRIDYNYKEYFLDTAEELETINTKACSPGSIAYIISSGDVYMLNSKKEWILQ